MSIIFIISYYYRKAVQCVEESHGLLGVRYGSAVLWDDTVHAAGVPFSNCACLLHVVRGGKLSPSNVIIVSHHIS